MLVMLVKARLLHQQVIAGSVMLKIPAKHRDSFCGIAPKQLPNGFDRSFVSCGSKITSSVLAIRKALSKCTRSDTVILSIVIRYQFRYVSKISLHALSLHSPAYTA